MSAATRPTLGHLDVTFLSEDAVSRNGRFYPAETVRDMVETAQRDIDAGVPLTFFACHESGLAGDISRMGGVVSKVWMEGSKARARISVLDTSTGRDLATVARAGALKTVSLRSVDFNRAGIVERDGRRLERVNRVRLAGIDSELVPGIPSVSVDAVALESALGDAWRLPPLTETFEAADLVYQETALAEGWLPAGTTQGDLDDGDFAWISDDGKTRKLPYQIHGTVSERGWRAAWNAVHGARTAMDFSGGPSKEATIATLLAHKPAGVEVTTERYQPCTNPACDPSQCTCGPSCACTESAPCGCQNPGGPEMQSAPPSTPLTEASLEAVLAEAGRRLSQANEAELSAVRAHIAHANAVLQMAHGRLGSVIDPSDPDRAPNPDQGDEDMSNGVNEALQAQLTTLTESVQAQGKNLETQGAAIAALLEKLTAAPPHAPAAPAEPELTEREKALAARLTEAEDATKAAKELLEKAQAEREALHLQAAADWRPGRKVPVTALAEGLIAQYGDQDVPLAEQKKIAMQVYGERLINAQLGLS